MINDECCRWLYQAVQWIRKWMMGLGASSAFLSTPPLTPPSGGVAAEAAGAFGA